MTTHATIPNTTPQKPRQNGQKGKKSEQNSPASELKNAESEKKATRKTEAESVSRRPRPLTQLLPDSHRSSPLLWGLEIDAIPNPTKELVTDLDQLVRSGIGAGKRGKKSRKQDKSGQDKSERPSKDDWTSRLEEWLTTADVWLARQPAQRSGEFLLEALAWCHALPQLDSMLPDEMAGRLHGSLRQLARDPADKLAATPAWAYHLLGELGFTLAYLYSDDSVDSGWDEASREGLTHGICELTDGEGQVHALHLSLMYPLLACWTRCQVLARAMEPKSSAFLQEGEDQYRWFLQQVLRWTRRDAQPMALTGVQRELTGIRELWQAALNLEKVPATRFLAAAMLPKRWGLTSRRDTQLKHAAEPALSMVAEWAEGAILRGSWERNSTQLAVTFDEGTIRSELSVGKRVVWSGPSMPQLLVDGEHLVNEGPADLICTFSDEDAEYIEIELEYPGDWRLQRQILLGRGDDFLLIADAILGPKAASISYSSSFPLTEGTTFRGEEETNEGWLRQDDHPLALVLPLALAEWRTARRTGSLEQQHGNLTLSHQATAAAMFCPLFIDFSPKRHDKPHTWRQLTVAEKLEIQSPEAAVGYRVQIHKLQWLIYRALNKSGMRTVLGQHFSQEFVMGRFTTDGELEQILQID